MFTSRSELFTSEPVSAEIGGAQGVTFEINVEEDQTIFSDPLDGAFVAGLHQSLQVFVVDVGGTPVTVLAMTTLGSWDRWFPEAQAILDSIVWKDLG